MKNKIIYIMLLATVSVSLQAQDTLVLSLRTCKKMATENAMEIRNAELDISYAMARKSEAFTYYFPTVEASAMGFHFKRPLLTIESGELLGTSDLANNINWYFSTIAGLYGLNTSYSLLRSGYSAGLTLMQPVYAGGKIANSNRLASLGIEVAGLKKEVSAKDEAVVIEKKYWAIVSLEEKLAVIESGIRLLDSLYADVNAAYMAGLAVEKDRLEVSQECNSLKVQRTKLRSGIRLAKMNLLNGIGMKYSVSHQFSEDSPHIDDIRLSDGLPYTEEPQEYYYEPESALAMMPEAQLLDMSVKSHEIQKKIFLADVLPQVGIGSTFGYGRITDSPQWNGAVFATIRIPISDWGRVSHKVRQEDILRQKAANEREYLDNQLVLHIRQMWENVVVMWDLLAVAEDKVTLKKISACQVEKDYEAGITTFTRHLEAQTALLTASEELYDARIAYNNAVCEYISASGKIH